MSNQIIKHDISLNIFFELLDKICIKTDKYYIVNNISYKKGLYLDLFDSFNNTLIKSYYKSKQFYILRKQNYNTFVTIIRQICKKMMINYNSRILYNKSSYDIVYYIYN